MTKKDYELFANEIYNYSQTPERNNETLEVLVRVASYCFKQDNPAFNPDKFERACYEGKHIRKAISGKV